MKKIFFLATLVFTTIFHAQIKEKISWQQQVKDLGNNEFEVQFIANLENGWHVYSLDNASEDIYPTLFTLEKNSNYKTLTKLQANGKKKTEFSKAFNTNLSTFEGKIVYSQKIKALTDKPFTIDANVEYQVCDDKMCLAPESEIYSVKITPKAIENSTQKVNSKKDTLQSNTVLPSKENQVKNDITTENLIVSNQTSKTAKKNNLIIPSIDVKNPLTKNCIETQTKDKTYFNLFLLGFIGGLLALLTPCVYPMVPLTISYFTKSSEKVKGKRNAFIYALFIALIFVAFTIPFHIFSDISENIFNQISTNVWLNIFFFLIFVFFAFSFFGYYEITLPSSWINKSDKASDAGGIVGLFFMALTLVIVSFSCTGPILGSLLAGSISSANGAKQLTSAFAGFGLSWAIVFGVFAMFPQLLKSLPKSGGWMNTLKVVLGFLELGLALKFLSKADLVSKFFLIKRELFVAIWIVICLLTILYLLGFISFPHDEKPRKRTSGKIILSIIFGAFALYLSQGLFPSEKPNLKALSGITPPMFVSYYKTESCPLGLNCYHDYFEALEIAKQQKKPLMIDFTGYGCENCRKMEEFVWVEDDVYKLLNNEVILTSLYVDDKEELPENQKEIVQLKDGRKRKIETIGNKWATFQKENFLENSQPQYVLLTPDEKVINFPISGYNDKETFLQFLECGINYYKESNK